MWLNPQKTVDLVTFTEKILIGKLHFLCSGIVISLNYDLDNVEALTSTVLAYLGRMHWGNIVNLTILAKYS